MLFNRFDIAAEGFVFFPFIHGGHLVILRFLPDLEVTEIAIFIQFTTGQGGQDRAAGFLGVAAVVITTIPGKREDVFKPQGYPITGAEEAKFSHSRRINQHGALIEDDKLPPGGGRGAFSGSTDRSGLEDVVANEAVDEGGLADTR